MEYKYYAVARGRAPGIYASHTEAVLTTLGFPGGECHGCTSITEAFQYLADQDMPDESIIATAATLRLHINIVKSPVSGRRIIRVLDNAAPPSSPSTRGPRMRVYCHGKMVRDLRNSCNTSAAIAVVGYMYVDGEMTESLRIVEHVYCDYASSDDIATLYAVIRALETAPLQIPVNIYTTSQYLCDTISKVIPRLRRGRLSYDTEGLPLIMHLSGLLTLRNDTVDTYIPKTSSSVALQGRVRHICDRVAETPAVELHPLT